jgi:hypothetical protein
METNEFLLSFFSLNTPLELQCQNEFEKEKKKKLIKSWYVKIEGKQWGGFIFQNYVGRVVFV